MRRLLPALGVLTISCVLCQQWCVSAKAAEPQDAAKATDPGVLFDKLDSTHSGVLSADKIPADKRSLFDRLLRLAGKPSDGQLTRAEFVAQLKSITEPPASGIAPSSNSGSANSGSGGSTSNPPAGTAPAKSAGTPPANEGRKQPDPAKAFDRMDKNHTGKLTISDVPEERQKFFKRLLKEAGKPADGSLTKDEFAKAFDAVLAKRDGAPGAKTAATGKNKPTATDGQGFDVDTLVARLMKLSTRPDGKLTKSDLPEKMQARFEKIDANNDGLVDEAELRTWLTKVKRQLAAAKALSGSTSPSK